MTNFEKWIKNKKNEGSFDAFTQTPQQTPNEDKFDKYYQWFQNETMGKYFDEIKNLLEYHAKKGKPEFLQAFEKFKQELHAAGMSGNF